MYNPVPVDHESRSSAPPTETLSGTLSHGYSMESLVPLATRVAMLLVLLSGLAVLSSWLDGLGREPVNPVNATHEPSPEIASSWPAPPSARTPPMGWNSWNRFQCNINEDLVKQTADAMVSSGLLEAGYKFLNLDDCWLASSRDRDGNLQADPVKFPSGMKALADYVHSKGLYFGLYADSGWRTCAGRMGSLGNETADANTLAQWGVDFLKYDNCATPNEPPQKRYGDMGKALQNSGRRIIFSMCNWGQWSPATWARQAGADLWRTTSDINNTWDSFMEHAAQNDKWAKYAGVGAWNDPDMLEVGNGMSENEDRVHFSLWAIIKAPLLIGCDVRKMGNATKSILLHKEVISINQDSSGIQASQVMKHSSGYEMWSGPLSNGSQVVAVINRRHGAIVALVNMKAALGVLWTGSPLSMRDLWKGQSFIIKEENVTLDIPSYDVKLLKFSIL